MPNVSVIVPVYKVEKFIKDCIESILNQSYQDFELILVDDGSPDNSGIICDEYAEKDSRITVIHQENQGQAAARNNAIKIANGEWLSFVDSDDMIHHDFLKILTDEALQSGVNYVCANAFRGITPNPDFYESVDCLFNINAINEESLTELYKTAPCYWCVWGCIIKSDIVKNNLFTPGKFYEDNAVANRWLYSAKTISLTDAQLYFYRIAEGSTTNDGISIKFADYLWALQQQMDFLQSIGYNKLYSIICKRYLNTASGFYFTASRVLKNKEAAKTIRTDLKKRYAKNKDIVLSRNEKISVLSAIHPYSLGIVRIIISKIKNGK